MMRLWKIEDLFNKIHYDFPKARKHIRLVHICIKCGWKTPELPPIDIMVREISMHPPTNFEIRDNYCDKCNEQSWKELKDYCEYQKNNCEHCGGGRCSHYPDKE